jgi:hypothetical protein
MNDYLITLTIPLVVIIGGVVVIALGMFQRTKVLEMAHRERLAMIERGLVPPPSEHAEMRGDPVRGVLTAKVRRSMTLGILLIGLGLGLGMLIGFAGGAPDAAVGVGGAVVVVGGALVVNALVMARGPAPAPNTQVPAVPSTFARRDPTDLS